MTDFDPEATVAASGGSKKLVQQALAADATAMETKLMSDIQRLETNEKLSRVVIHQGVAYLSGLTADDRSADAFGQTLQVLRKADALLGKAQSDKSKILSAQIWMRDINEFDEMNRAWITWLEGTVPPARATVGATFALPDIHVEIQFTAAV
ncbi:RidA family protein [Mesorhizobium sp. C277A]|uniref:RidA family protein n=2 Tax=Mesorhizobium TaxID=68287 RepID=UPI001FDAA7BA|nr:MULTISPECIES: RidA family protein [unclassified Mesorhizobium]